MESHQADRRRSPFEIRMDVLRAIGRGSEAVTYMMREANVAWVVLEGNVNALEKCGFVTHDWFHTRRVFRLTLKGQKVLSDYLDLRASIEPEQVEEELEAR